MKWLLTSLWPGPRMLAAAACAMAVLHILATLAAPQFAPARAFNRLTAGVPVHKMTLLAPVTPASQKLPFMSADALYAVCPFDTKSGQIAVTAKLPAPGWALALYTPEGENFYVAVAQPGRATDVSVLLIAADDRFLGLTPQARGLSPRDAAQLKLPADKGFALVRAPDLGQAYRQQTLAALREARCSVQVPQ